MDRTTLHTHRFLAIQTTVCFINYMYCHSLLSLFVPAASQTGRFSCFHFTFSQLRLYFTPVVCCIQVKLKRHQVFLNFVQCAEFLCRECTKKWPETVGSRPFFLICNRIFQLLINKQIPSPSISQRNTSF